jgi:hypothetical protein
MACQHTAGSQHSCPCSNFTSCSIAWTSRMDLPHKPLSVLANMRRCCSHPPDRVSCMLCGCVFCYGASWRGREGNPTVNLVNTQNAKHRNAPQFECCKNHKKGVCNSNQNQNQCNCKPKFWRSSFVAPRSPSITSPLITSGITRN